MSDSKFSSIFIVNFHNSPQEGLKFILPGNCATVTGSFWIDLCKTKLQELNCRDIVIYLFFIFTANSQYFLLLAGSFELHFTRKLWYTFYMYKLENWKYILTNFLTTSKKLILPRNFDSHRGSYTLLMWNYKIGRKFALALSAPLGTQLPGSNFFLFHCKLWKLNSLTTCHFQLTTNQKL